MTTEVLLLFWCEWLVTVAFTKPAGHQFKFKRGPGFATFGIILYDNPVLAQLLL